MSGQSPVDNQNPLTFVYHALVALAVDDQFPHTLCKPHLVLHHSPLVFSQRFTRCRNFYRTDFDTQICASEFAGSDLQHF